jgi:hypothetical protein
LKKIVIAAVLAAAMLAPAASAGRPHRVKLAVVVLPKPALGSVGRSLAVARDQSGPISNAEAGGNSFGGTARTFSKLGRITGYALSYGDPYSGRRGVTLIETGVDEYKTSAGANRGLAFWQKDDPKITAFVPYGVPLTVKAVKAAKVGKHRFAEASIYAIPGAAPLSLVDEQFSDGRYVLKVDVAAGSVSEATGLAGKLARHLDHRLRLAEAGHLHGKPVKLPPKPSAGPPAGGPDLAALALTASDLGGPATLGVHQYAVPISPGLSEYELDFQPAGKFADLSQTIDWFPTANDATVVGRIEAAGFAYLFATGLLGTAPGQFTPVDLSAVGDGAYGGIVTIAQTGEPTIYIAVFGLSSGQASDVVLAASESQILADDVVNLAQVTANRLDTGLAG